MAAIKVFLALFGNVKHTWPLALEAGRKLATLKKIGRIAYPDLDEVQLLHKLASYSEQDILDALGEPARK